MGATVEHVEARHRERARRGAPEVAKQRETDRRGGGAGDGERDAEDGVGAESFLVGGSVEIEHHLVDVLLLRGVEPDHLRCDRLVDIGDSPLHALSAVAVSAVPKLVGFECPCGCAGGYGRPTEPSASEEDLGLDRRVTPGIQDLAGPYLGDRGHVWALSLLYRRGYHGPCRTQRTDRTDRSGSTSLWQLSAWPAPRGRRARRATGRRARFPTPRRDARPRGNGRRTGHWRGGRRSRDRARGGGPDSRR